MEHRLTPKQEAFCLAYLETGNASEAYRQVYETGNMKPTTIGRSAKEMLDNPKVSAKIQELRTEVAQAAMVTYEGHIRDLQRLRDAAAKAGQYGAAVKAEVARGKAAGLYTERLVLAGGVEVNQVQSYDFSGIPQEELLALVREAFGGSKDGEQQGGDSQ